MIPTDRSQPSGEARSFPQGLATLPVFFKLQGRRVVMAGGSPRAAWKGELAHAAGAEVDVFCEDPCADLLDLVSRAARVRLVDRAYRPADLEGAALAIGDFEDRGEAQAFQAAGRARGVPVNCIDLPDFCDVQFGSIIDRSPLVVAIGSDGAAPVLAQAVRGRLEALLPRTLRDWAAAAAAWRPRLGRLDLPMKTRRRFWELFAAQAVGTHAEAPDEPAIERMLDQAIGGEGGTGRVILVGAGPGDPDLLTLKGLRALQTADVVLYDDLVAPEIVDLARREARKIYVGKRGYRPSCKQDQIVETMIALARQGDIVVRLKGGDPMVFGRANEEAAALAAAGIAMQVVPGVTAALGAAASLGVSLTERDHARRLQFITAHARDGRLPEDIAWSALCDPRASTIVYMGVRTLRPLSERLLAEGIDPATPAVLVERATCVDERRVAGTIADLPGKVEAARPQGPCLVMLGAIFGHVATRDPAVGGAIEAARRRLA